MPVNPSLELRLQPSRIWMGLLVGVNLLAITLLLVLPLTVMLRVLTLVVLVFMFIAARQYRQWLDGFDRLSQREESWQLWKAGTEDSLQICGLEYVSGGLIVLKAEAFNDKITKRPFLSRVLKNNTVSVPLFVDAMDKAGFHQLQLQVRNGGL
ncbi:MAG: protein YgfX [Porticoccaceae bacterium]